MNIQLEKGLEEMRIQTFCEPGNEGSPVRIMRLLTACTDMKDLHKGSKLHEYIRERNWMAKNTYIGNALVSMYAKCCDLAKAHQVFKQLPMRDVVSWTALIAGYAQHGQGQEALKCFDDMLGEGYAPNAVTFICVLKACGSIRAAAKGEQIYEKVVSMGMLEDDIVLGNTLVDMYAKCGVLDKAHQVLKELPMHDVVSWNTLIAGHSQQGQGEEALKCYDDMLCEGHSPDAITFTCALKACGSIRAAAKGKQIHDKIVSLGMLEKSTMVGNTLVDMYAKCGALVKAHQVLKGLPMRNVVSWTALISGHAQEGQGEEALKCFSDMVWEGHSPNAVTFICVLKACGIIRAASKGEEMHEKIVSMGMLEKDTVLGNMLVDTYAKCGVLGKAHQVLKELLMRDVVSWTILIAGHVHLGQGGEALKCFDDMLCEGHSPNAITFICVLKACGSMAAAVKGEEIHDKIVSLGMLGKDIVLGTTLVDMYAKFGALDKAHQVLKELPMRDVVSWNALIAGHGHQERGEEALKCYDDMLCEGHSPDAVTFICVLKACGRIGAAIKGKEIHDKILSLGNLDKNIFLINTLVDMYVKCGALARVQQVLEELFICDTFCCNALMAGYARQSDCAEAIKCFQHMQSNGMKPDLISLTIMLNACSHSGLLDQAQAYFSGMNRKYGIHPSLEHYCCMVDVFARAGKFNKALSVITEMPYNECLSGCVAVLGACHKWAEMKIGMLAFEQALNLDIHNAAVYILMADIYTTAGMQEEVHKQLK